MSGSIESWREIEWLWNMHRDLIEPRKKAIEHHPFTRAMREGSAEPVAAQRYFSGLMWHLLDFGKHVSHLMQKRPSAVATLLEGRSEDKDGDTEILARIVRAFGGPEEQIRSAPWSFRPHRAWVEHDALLRSAIYSTDLEWQVGTAALNIGIESLVPTMIEPLFESAIQVYGVSRQQAQWLESRSGPEERQHGENGWILLAHGVPKSDKLLQQKCRFYVDALSHSMAYRLLESGLRRAE